MALNKTVVIRYRIFLEQAHYASSTINLRLAAVRRLAYEAADAGLLSPDLAAGIRRDKGVKKSGLEWAIGSPPNRGDLHLAFSIGTTCQEAATTLWPQCCWAADLRRAEVAALGVQALQQWEEHWVFTDLASEGGHVRTVQSCSGLRLHYEHGWRRRKSPMA